jgi:Spy/CpxP family protein refolding chaperone
MNRVCRKFLALMLAIVATAVAAAGGQAPYLHEGQAVHDADSPR